MIARAPTGFPAARKLFRDDFPPLLRAVDPFLRNLNPLVVGLNLYKKSFTSFFANIGVATNSKLVPKDETESRQNTLRAMVNLNPETVATYPNRLSINRSSAYSPPEWAKGLLEGLPSLITTQCSGGLVATLDPNVYKDPAFQESVPHKNSENAEKAAEVFLKRLKEVAFAAPKESKEQEEGKAPRPTISTGEVPAPPCKQQERLKSIYGSGEETLYQHTFEKTGN